MTIAISSWQELRNTASSYGLSATATNRPAVMLTDYALATDPHRGGWRSRDQIAADISKLSRENVELVGTWGPPR